MGWTVTPFIFGTSFFFARQRLIQSCFDRARPTKNSLEPLPSPLVHSVHPVVNKDRFLNHVIRYFEIKKYFLFFIFYFLIHFLSKFILDSFLNEVIFYHITISCYKEVFPQEITLNTTFSIANRFLMT